MRHLSVFLTCGSEIARAIKSDTTAIRNTTDATLANTEELKEGQLELVQRLKTLQVHITKLPIADESRRPLQRVATQLTEHIERKQEKAVPNFANQSKNETPTSKNS